MPISPNSYESIHYMVLPEQRFLNSPSNLNFVLTFSGVALIDGFKGENNGNWNRDVLYVSIENIGLQQIQTRLRGTLPNPPNNYSYFFIPLQWSICSSPNSFFNSGQAVNTGFAVDRFRIANNTVENINGQTLNALGGINIDIAIRDKDAYLYRAAYYFQAYGYFEPAQYVIYD